MQHREGNAVNQNREGATTASQSTHEIGIWMALGGQRRDVLRLIMAEASANSIERAISRRLPPVVAFSWHFAHLTEEALRQEFCQGQHTVYFETVYVGDHRSYLERNGERRMKDTVHPHVHRSVHAAGERKC